MDNHCFISYSHADGLKFVEKLILELEGGYPSIPAWFEKRDMHVDKDDWDDQLAKAIQQCKCLIYVMSADSTANHSNCKDEWTWALKYKKPVICLQIDNKATDQFRLSSRQKIDFITDFGAGLGKLRKAIAHLDSPEGQLEELNHRLADANRDLRRASDVDKLRIQADIDELEKQIEVQERIASNPQAAQAQTQENIAAGLERERKPEKPAAAQTSTKFINPPPGIAPNYYQDRLIETEQIVHFLQDDSQRLMTIVGRGGVGKTAMVCRLLKGLEAGELPDGLGKMRVEGIVYLSESGSHRVNFANLFYDLCKLLPSDAAAARELDAVYKNPQGSTESKMRALLEKFGGGHVVVLLDNFEPLVDTETFAIRDAELDEALRAFLNGTHSAVKVVITTRVAPRALNLVQPGRQRGLTLDEGLESPYAENILREMDSDGRLGLKSAGAEALNRARIKTRGFPRALEALFAILASDRYTTLEELLAMPLPENVVEALVGEAFNRLDTNAQKAMQALAVYNRPVTPAAVDFLLAPHLPAMDSAPILQRLANMHFARKESGRFYLHPVDREFAYGLIPAEDLTAKTAKNAKENQKTDLVLPKYEELFKTSRSWRAPAPVKGSRFDAFTQHDLTIRAADYFAQARKPRAEWKKLEDLSAQLAEFDLRCAAGDYDTAADVLTDIDFDYLLLWGHYRLMIDLHEKLQGKINDTILAQANTGNLGTAYSHIGQEQKAVEFFNKALTLAQERNERQNEGVWLNNLGNVYSNLGYTHKATEYYEQALVIAHEIGDRSGEGERLANLGSSYGDLGNTHKAAEYYEQALVIIREIGNRNSEAVILSGIAECHNKLGQIDDAIEYQKMALAISQEIGSRDEEGIKLSILGSYYSDLDNQEKAKEYFEKSLVIAHETGYRYGEGYRLLNLAGVEIELNNYKKAIELALQSSKIGNEISRPHLQNNAYLNLSVAYLLSESFLLAQQTIEAALGYDVPENNHNASALHGIIALRQGDEVTARGAFVRAIGQADEILSKTAEYYSALDAKGLSICGLLICDLPPSGTSRLGRGAVPAPDGDDDAKTGRGDPAPTMDDAIETFRKARRIAPHAGIVKSVLRLFDELAKCDTEGILKDVRKAAGGKE